MPAGGARIVAALCAAVASTASARSLHDEAGALRATCLKNAAKLASVRFESRMTVQRLDARGAAAGQPEERAERVLWDRPGRRLKWTAPRADPSAYAADAKAGTLRQLNRALSVSLFDLPADRAEEYTTPFPGWLWHPEWIVPASPASVREEGAAFVVTSSRGHPRRDVWLDRARGYVLRFSETDATGALVRDVRCEGWASHDSVSLPSSITETIQGEVAGLRQTVRFEGIVVNAPLSTTEFSLP